MKNDNNKLYDKVQLPYFYSEVKTDVLSKKKVFFRLVDCISKIFKTIFA